MKILIFIFVLFSAFFCHAAPLDVAELDGYLKKPQVRAFLDTVAYAEGTLNEDSYKLMYGHYLHDDFSDHPRKVACIPSNGKPICSSAAGKYQFTQKTWDWLAKRLKATDFGPENQERAAVLLLKDKKALEDIERGAIEKAFAKVSTVWASLPKSPYDQPRKPISELRRMYKRRLYYYKRTLSKTPRAPRIKNSARRTMGRYI